MVRMSGFHELNPGPEVGTGNKGREDNRISWVGRAVIMKLNSIPALRRGDNISVVSLSAIYEYQFISQKLSRRMKSFHKNVTFGTVRKKI